MASWMKCSPPYFESMLFQCKKVGHAFCPEEEIRKDNYAKTRKKYPEWVHNIISSARQQVWREEESDCFFEEIGYNKSID